MHDVESIYTIPEHLREAGMDREVLTLLNLHDRVDQRKEDQARLKWRWFVDRIGKARKEVTIAITGKYTAVRDAYASIIKAGEHCGVHLGVSVDFRWIDTMTMEFDTPILSSEKFDEAVGAAAPEIAGLKQAAFRILGVARKAADL